MSRKYPPATDATPESLAQALVRRGPRVRTQLAHQASVAAMKTADKNVLARLS